MKLPGSKRMNFRLETNVQNEKKRVPFQNGLTLIEAEKIS